MINWLSLLTSGSLVGFLFCLFKLAQNYFSKNKKVDAVKTKKMIKIYFKAMLVCFCLLGLGITLYFALGF